MAVLCITEYNQPTSVPFSPQASFEPPIHEQTVAISGSSTQSAALQPATNLIRIHTDTTCAISLGSNPTAVAPSGTNTNAPGSQRMAANQTEFKNVKPGTSVIVAVITSS